MLDQGSNDAARLQEKPVWTPVKVQFAQLGCNVVMLAHQHGVEDGQARLLVDSVITSEEAIAINCATISVLLGDWKQRKQVRWTRKVLTPSDLMADIKIIDSTLDNLA